MCNANVGLDRRSVRSSQSTTLPDSKQLAITIEPPPQFQDLPPSTYLSSFVLSNDRSTHECVNTPLWSDKFASSLVADVLKHAVLKACQMAWSTPSSSLDLPTSKSFLRPYRQSMSARWNSSRLCWAPELVPFSPCRNRPGSRSSLASSRLSSSHSSLAANKADDSSFITSAMSHDVLTGNQITDMYNVPFDSDIYAVPIDMVKPLHECKPRQRPKRQQRHGKRRRHVSSGSQSELDHSVQHGHKPKTIHTSSVISSQIHVVKSQRSVSPDVSPECGKRHSVPGSSAGRRLRTECTEPIHMTLHEVRQYLQNLYSSSSDSSENKPKKDNIFPVGLHFDKPTNNNNKCDEECNDLLPNNFLSNSNNSARKHKKKTFVINIKNKNTKESCEIGCKDNTNADYEKDKLKKSCSGRTSFSTNLKQTLCNMFRIRKSMSPERVSHGRPAVVVEVVEDSDAGDGALLVDVAKAPFLRRALPPLPAINTLILCHRDALLTHDTDHGQIQEELEEVGEEPSMDFASSIQKVKDYGWYWGPISGEAAERILSNEPDGSFIVRDSSDDHYIFSLTFKLNGCIRHVRIEHDQGNFSFGSCTKFKSHTIVDFIENAVEHSRSGRYLFFLHRRPVLGPMRVQLLHPVSRFKQVQSLQHMCRFVILKLVRRDLIPDLPLPRRVIDYLSTPHYYSEQLVEEDSPVPSPVSEDAVDLISFVPQGLS